MAGPEYFARCLRGPFLESGTRTVKFDDIELDHPNLYLSECYRQKLCAVPNWPNFLDYVEDIEDKEDQTSPMNCSYICPLPYCKFEARLGTCMIKKLSLPKFEDLIAVYPPSDRFLNDTIKYHAGEGFVKALDTWMLLADFYLGEMDKRLSVFGRLYNDLLKEGPPKLEDWKEPLVSRFCNIHIKYENWNQVIYPSYLWCVEGRFQDGTPRLEVLPFVEALSSNVRSGGWEESSELLEWIEDAE